VTITFLGTGTSQGVPVIACDCEVCTSTDMRDKRLRASIMIQAEDKTVVIDSGPDFRFQMLREKVKHLDAIVYTHEHKDHIAGMDDIRAFNYSQNTLIDIYATERVQTALKREFSYVFAEYKYPGIPQINMHTINLDPFDIGSLHFIPIEVMHYKLPILGFRIGDFTYITDAKTISATETEKIRGTKVLVINALQTQSHVAHFTLDEAIIFAQKIGAEQTYLTHISHNLGLYNTVSKQLPASIELAFDGLKFTM
jgi:phosphoribosyl 1,2-cyclic phosphate phosphodiesterase